MKGIIVSCRAVNGKIDEKTSVEGAPCRGFTAEVRHHAAYYDLGNLILSEIVLKAGANESVVGGLL